MSKISLSKLKTISTNPNRFFFGNRWFLAFKRSTKKVVLPGFDNVPLYEVGDFFIKGILRGSVSIRAAAFSYNFFMALFPAIIFLFTIIPYIPIAGFQDQLLQLMQDFFPKATYAAVEDTVFDIIKRPRGGLLSLGFVLALYFATNGIHSLIIAFNQTYHSYETRTWVRVRLSSIFLVFILSFLLFIAIVLIMVGPIVIDFIADKLNIRDSFVYYLIITAKWFVTIALLFFAYSFLYYFAPARKSRFRFISAGSTLATILTIITSIGFNYYVNNFARYNSLYGSIGTLIIILVWIYFNAMIVLIGFELNVSIRHARENSSKESELNRLKQLH